MSNLERDPQELICEADAEPGIQVLEPRQVPLGGPRAMDVRRTLPQRGVQLWTALPDSARHTTPRFEHYVPPVVEFPEGNISVFLGSLAGQKSTATAFSPLVGAQIDLKAGRSITLPIEAGFEHGVLVDSGLVTVEGVAVPRSHLAYLGPGREQLRLEATTAARLVLVGGEPLGEQIVMWWNFIGRSHDEIVDYRARWQSEVVGGGTDAGHFGTVRGYDGPPLPAPAMPTVRLKPRG